MKTLPSHSHRRFILGLLEADSGVLSGGACELLNVARSKDADQMPDERNQLRLRRLDSLLEGFERDLETLASDLSVDAPHRVELGSFTRANVAVAASLLHQLGLEEDAKTLGLRGDDCVITVCRYGLKLDLGIPNMPEEEECRMTGLPFPIERPAVRQIDAIKDHIHSLRNCLQAQAVSDSTDDRRAINSEPEAVVDPSHSSDYRWVRWGGTEYTFTLNQALCVQFMWEQWLQRVSYLAQATILEGAGVGESGRLRDVFKQKEGMHPAWGNMIQKQEGTKDRFGLGPRASQQ